MSIPAWEGDWRGDLINAVTSLGFQRLHDYCAGKPAMTYQELARKLGEVAGREFAPVQIEQLLRDNATTREEIEEFVKSSFVRHLRSLMPEGWGMGQGSAFNFAHAVGAWTSRLPKKYAKQCENLAQYLIRIKPYSGWLPASMDDPLVNQAFHETSFNLFPLQEMQSGGKRRAPKENG